MLKLFVIMLELYRTTGDCGAINHGVVRFEGNKMFHCRELAGPFQDGSVTNFVWYDMGEIW